MAPWHSRIGPQIPLWKGQSGKERESDHIVDELRKLGQLEGTKRAGEATDAASSASVSALNQGLAASRLGNVPSPGPEMLAAAHDMPVSHQPSESESHAPSALNLLAFMEGLGSSKEAAPTQEVARQADAKGVWSRPSVAKALAVGGLLAGAAAGAFALGPAGLLLTMAAEALAFAGGVLISKAQQQQLEEVNKQLHFQANHDPLTGLRNRGSIFEFLGIEAEKSSKTRAPLAIILGDLDHFKSVNDNYGHLAGDAVLREVSRRIGAVLRAQDAVGRYGGEEILIVLPDTPGGQAVLVAERIRQLVAEEPVKSEVGSIPVTISLGVAAADNPVNVVQQALVQAADEALYRAKREGRNRVAFSKYTG